MDKDKKLAKDIENEANNFMNLMTDYSKATILGSSGLQSRIRADMHESLDLMLNMLGRQYAAAAEALKQEIKKDEDKRDGA